MERAQVERTSHGGRPRRVVVVRGTFFAEQLHLWRACREAGINLGFVGTTFNPYGGMWPWHSDVPTDIPSEDLEPLRLRPRRGHHWWVYPKLARALNAFQPDIVHIHSEPWTPLTLQILLLKKARRIRAKVVVHGDEFTYWQRSFSPKRLVRRAVLRFVLSSLDGYACVSSYGASQARQHGLRDDVPSAHLPAIVPNVDRFCPASAIDKRRLRRVLGLPLDKVVVGYVGRLEPEKGVLDVLAAATDIRHEQLFLAVWGAGTLQDRIVELLRGGSQAPGRFLGSLDLVAVAETVRGCDIVVVSEQGRMNEQFGRVAVEAMSCSCAVLATRSGALAEVVGDGGMIIAPDNPTDLAQGLRKLVSDADQRLLRGMKGRDRVVHQFAPTAVAQQVIDFWSAVDAN